MSFLWFGEVQPYECEAHPAVPLSILHHYIRKPSNSSYACGLILGTQSEQVMQAKVAISLLHTINTKNVVSIGKLATQQYCKLVQQAYPSYKLIGAYFVGQIEAQTIALHTKIEGFFDSSLLYFSVTFEAEEMKIQAYQLPRLGLKNLAVLEPVVTKVLKQPLNMLVKERVSYADCLAQIKRHLEGPKDEVKSSVIENLEKLLRISADLPNCSSLDLRQLEGVLRGVLETVELTEKDTEQL